MTRCTLGLAMLFILAASASAQLAIQRVVLYKNGLGLFQAAGRAGAAPLHLDFKADEMNDVLASLTIEAANGGPVTRVSFPSGTSLQDALATYHFHLRPAESLGALLDQFRGERIEVASGAARVAGLLLGARTLPAAQDGGAPRPHDQLTLLLDSGGVRRLILAPDAAVRFANPRVDRQLRRYLSLIAASRSPGLRSLVLEAGGAARRITVRYLLPVAVWRSTYRLVLNGDRARLQGWAIVANSSDKDWDDVQLSLVSGRPTSFLMQLYRPLYRSQSWASLPEEYPLTPRLYGSALEAAARHRTVVFGRAGGGVAGGMTGGVLGGIISGIAPPPPPSPPPLLAPRPIQIANQPRTADLGGLFEYRFSRPVTIRRGQSAMIPFLDQPVTVRRISIYAVGDSTHPRQALEIVNSTGKTLDGGPITVYDAGAYAGEALMETLRAGDKRPVSYAQDLGTLITTSGEPGPFSMREIHMNRGVLACVYAEDQRTVFRTRNLDGRPKRLVLEYPIVAGFNPVHVKPSEITAAHYRFAVAVAPNAQLEFPVVMERVVSRTATVSNMTPDSLLVYAQNQSFAPQARRELQTLLDLKRRVAAAQARLEARQAALTEIGDDETRLRQDIDTLNRVPGTRQRVRQYIARLDGDEERLPAARAALHSVAAEHDRLQTQLDDTIADMRF